MGHVTLDSGPQWTQAVAGPNVSENHLFYLQTKSFVVPVFPTALQVEMMPWPVQGTCHWAHVLHVPPPASSRVEKQDDHTARGQGGDR